MLRLLVLVRKLDIGGAENQLLLFAQGAITRGHEVTVVTFYPGGTLEDEFLRASVPILSLRKKGRWDIVFPVLRFLRMLRRKKTERVYSLLTGPNLIAVFGKFSRPRLKVFWGIRSSAHDSEIRPNDFLVKILAFASVYLSRFPERIIVNSQTAMSALVAQGIAPRKIVKINNGVDEKSFFFKPELGRQYKRENNISDHVFLVGMVARLDPIKNYEMFIEGVAEFATTERDSNFLIVGSGADDYLQLLQGAVTHFGLSDRVRFCGDVEARTLVGLLNALDAFVLTSRSESFSNALAEALMCGVPAIATNVGEAQAMLGENDRLISTDQPEELVDGLRNIRASNIDPASRAISAKRFVRSYAADRMIDETICLFSD